MGFFDDLLDVAKGGVLPFVVDKATGWDPLGLYGAPKTFGSPAKLTPPPPPPDATDIELRQAALAQRRRLLLGRGMGGTFASGPLGDMSPITTAATSAGGY